jgi:hypothetical protein
MLLQKPWALEEPLVKPRFCIGIGEERSKAGGAIEKEKVRGWCRGRIRGTGGSGLVGWLGDRGCWRRCRRQEERDSTNWGGYG